VRSKVIFAMRPLARARFPRRSSVGLAGLGYLTFLSPPLAGYLSPYNLAPAALGEGSLMLWLLVFGVNARLWKEQASKAAGLHA
jgi:hypothetical protein